MKRTAALHRTGRLSYRSKKAEIEAADRRIFVVEFLARHPRCEIRAPGCARDAFDVHEPLTRGRGGSILDPENAVALCRPCHDRIHAHPAWAAEHGFLLARGDDPAAAADLRREWLISHP